MDEMNEEEFRRYLRRKGKKPSVVDSNVAVLKDFASYMEKREKSLDDVSADDIDAFVRGIEAKKQSVKGHLYVLMNYFRFKGKTDLLDHARNLREERTEKSRRVFPIKEFLNVSQEHIRKLEAAGIKDVQQMLERGRTRKQREQLSRQLDIPEQAILELVKLSDIARIDNVRKKLSRLYYESGLDAPHKIAEFEPEKLHTFFTKYVKESGWNGMVPNPKDLISNIRNARRLPRAVEE